MQTVEHTPAEVERRRMRVRSRFASADTLIKISGIERVANCRRYRAHNQIVTIRRNEQGATSFGGLQTCGSVWACPNCSARIRQQRGDELEAGARRWLEAGHGLLFWTLTTQHHRGESLEVVLERVLDGYRRLQQSRAFRELKLQYRVAGTCRAVETTVGLVNGWHPHLHLLLFTEKPLTDAQHKTLARALTDLWTARVPSSRLAGSKLLKATSATALARYLVKVQDDHHTRGLGIEMTRGDLKKGRHSGRTPFQLLESLAGMANPEVEAPSTVRLWREYERATRGRRCLTWSTGMRQLLGIGVELDDEELATTPDGEVLMYLAQVEWRIVLRTPGGRGKILVAADVGGEAHVKRILDRWQRRLERQAAARAA